jgi:hypothetical protein
MTRKRPDVQPCGVRHEHYLHCLTCNPPPAERPERLRGPEVGTLCRLASRYPRFDGLIVRVTQRSYVWAPGDPAYHGGSRHYDWKVIEYGGKTMCVDDKDLELIATGQRFSVATEEVA